MTPSSRILIGLGAGILVGLFFGERAAELRWAADGFVKLLQMTVLPYMTVSIVTSLGRLDYVKPGRSVPVWGPSSRPSGSSPSSTRSSFPWRFRRSKAHRSSAPRSSSSVRHSTSSPFTSPPTRSTRSPSTWCLPSCCFRASWGIALIGVEHKSALLDVMDVVADALSRAARFVTKLAPYGLFAIAATAAGTLDLEELSRLQVYLLTYMVVALLLSVWVLPGLIAALTPIPLERGAPHGTSAAADGVCGRRSLHRPALAHRCEQDPHRPLR